MIVYIIVLTYLGAVQPLHFRLRVADARLDDEDCFTASGA